MSDTFTTITLLQSEYDNLKDLVDYVSRLDTAVVQRYLDGNVPAVLILEGERATKYKEVTDAIRVIMNGQIHERQADFTQGT